MSFARFVTEEEWEAAYSAVETELLFAESQGYLMAVTPNSLRALAVRCVQACVRSSPGDGDISDVVEVEHDGI